MKPALAFEEQDYMSRAREVFIRILLLAIMLVTCFLILRPFLPLIAWGVLIAVAVFPACRKLQKLLGGREKLAAAIVTFLLLLLVILPVTWFAGTMVSGVQSLVGHLQAGTLNVPPPPESIGSWPVIGVPIAKVWKLASSNLTELLQTLSPQLQKYIPAVLAASAEAGSAVLQLIVSILLAGFLLSNGPGNAKAAKLIFGRIFGEQAPEFQELTAATVRSVTNGILGVSAIQAFFASIGFVLIGLPAVGLWAVAFLVAAIVQIGAVVLIAAAAFSFTIASTTHALIFLVWCMIVGMMDNVLKPMLMGRGVNVPIAVIFVGVLGGFVAMGMIGLFLGPILLGVGYKLVTAWLGGVETAIAESA